MLQFNIVDAKVAKEEQESSQRKPRYELRAPKPESNGIPNCSGIYMIISKNSLSLRPSRLCVEILCSGFGRRLEVLGEKAA
jgi:hypothetical protein